MISNITLGVLGGMGPLVSSQFVSDIYSESEGYTVEQERPTIMALHQSTFPDRTQAILSGQTDVLLKELRKHLQVFKQCGCQKVIVPCFTLHTVFHDLSSQERGQIWDLLQVVRDELKPDSKYLVLCTNGSRQQRIFDDIFQETPSHIVYPEQTHQAEIHALIYQLKRGQNFREIWPSIASILSQYAVDGVISGCTELYLMWPHLSPYCFESDRHHVDALRLVQSQIHQEFRSIHISD